MIKHLRNNDCLTDSLNEGASVGNGVISTWYTGRGGHTGVYVQFLATKLTAPGFPTFTSAWIDTTMDLASSEHEHLSPGKGSRFHGGSGTQFDVSSLLRRNEQSCQMQVRGG